MQPSYPHQLPMTLHHSPASACHVLGVKGSPPIVHQNETPPSPAPHTINPFGRQRWIGATHDPVPSAEDPPPLQKAAVTNI